MQGRGGTGKTSFALSLAAALAPFGTRTLYVSAEESEDQLTARLDSVLPTYLRTLSFSPELAVRHDWIRHIRIGMPSGGIDVDSGLQRLTLLADVLSRIEQHIGSWKRHPSDAPAMIVLDSVHEYFRGWHGGGTRQEGEAHFARLIESCRQFNAIVVVVGSPDAEVVRAIDGLSSISIDLHHSNTSNVSDKPFRVFELRKTRHQASRVGAHLFHISGQKGFRISPQLGSQVDRGSERSARLPVVGGNIYFDAFERIWDSNTSATARVFTKTRPWMRYYPDSQILVHGRGSTGKAGFGLKLLMAPPLQLGPHGTEIIKLSPRPRVLVVSFLYQEEYYRYLGQKLVKLLIAEYGDVRGVDEYLRYADAPWVLDVVHLHPGHLRVEDLYAKLNDRIERARLEGIPYTGVLFDGFHNMFLSFPNLSNEPLMWPAMYALLRTLPNVTTVTTHTAISVNWSTSDPEEYRLERDRAFLLALVQATDFFLEIDEHEVGRPGENQGAPSGALPTVDLFKVNARSAIGQRTPGTSLLWSRSDLTLHAPFHSSN